MNISELYKLFLKYPVICTDSRSIIPESIFFSLKGEKFNGNKFAKQALEKGSRYAIVDEKEHYTQGCILVKDVKEILQKLATLHRKHLSIPIIGITGTNGKTSVADLFYQILKLNKIPVASIGTLGIKLREKIIKSNLTSPDTILLHKSLDNIKRKKIDNVIIEASSHGLDQKRLEHLNLKAGIFTNFSLDHLDYHKTMKSYFNFPP